MGMCMSVPWVRVLRADYGMVIHSCVVLCCVLGVMACYGGVMACDGVIDAVIDDCVWMVEKERIKIVFLSFCVIDCVFVCLLCGCVVWLFVVFVLWCLHCHKWKVSGLGQG
jgi:hypothetical protein